MGSLLKSNLHIKESIDVRQRQFACRAALEAADGRQTPHRISREIAAGAIHCFPMPLATTGPCCLDFCVATQSVPGGLLPHALSTIATLLSTRTDFKEWTYRLRQLRQGDVGKDHTAADTITLCKEWCPSYVPLL